MDPLKFESKDKGCELVHFDLSFSNMCITIMALSVSMLGCCVSVSYLGTSKKLSLGV